MSNASLGGDCILDTQIISYSMKRTWPEGVVPVDISDATISSVTAHELLEVSTGNHEPYYLYAPLVPEILGWAVPRAFDRAHRRPGFRGKHRTDQISLYFGNDYPPQVEYGHLMIGWLLKHKRTDSYARRISHLDKRDRRRLIDVFNYLVDNNIRCVSLDRNKAQLGIDLLHQYAASGNNLKANFRNSLNDMFILATAIDAAVNLTTEDRALWRFAAGALEIPVKARGPIMQLEISPKFSKSGPWRESKGYINRPWQAHTRSRNFPDYRG